MCSPSQEASPSCSCKSLEGGCTHGARCLHCLSGYRNHRGPWFRKGGRMRKRCTEQNNMCTGWCSRYGLKFKQMPSLYLITRLRNVRHQCSHYPSILLYCRRQTQQEFLTSSALKESTVIQHRSVHLICECNGLIYGNHTNDSHIQ